MSPPPSSPQKSPAPAAAPTPAAPAPAPERKKRARRSFVPFLLLGLVTLAFAGALFYFGVLPRFAAKAELDREQKWNGQRDVVYAVAKLSVPEVVLPLPGTVEAFQQASLYARTSGYVKRWNADIGDVVHEGDVLAEIDTPEVDQQLTQAKANAAQATAARQIAQATADRYNEMAKQRAVSQQDADEKNATLEEAKATLNADNAEVGRLTALENFKRVVAPFTGKITYRNIEIGNLVTAPTGNNSSTGGTSEIFRIAQTDPLRVYVDVPEANTRAIMPGVIADLHVAAYPDRVFHGEIVRSAGAIDNSSRTLRTEIRVANPDGALLPGAFAEVSLNLVDGDPAVLIPANALIVNSAGAQVALVENVNGQDKIHFLPVKVGRDFGTQVEILQDVKDGDRLVTNPPADITEAEPVTAKPADQTTAPIPLTPKS